MVPTKGLEPSPRERYGPEPYASANSATSAHQGHSFAERMGVIYSRKGSGSSVFSEKKQDYSKKVLKGKFKSLSGCFENLSGISFRGVFGGDPAGIRAQTTGNDLLKDQIQIISPWIFENPS